MSQAHFLNVAIAFQEWGDRSMLATIALGAAQVDFLLIFLCLIYFVLYIFQ